MLPKMNIETDWQLQCGDLKQRAITLLQTGQWADCAFLVGPVPDQVDFKAHKLFLTMASPVFEAMFYGPIAEGNGPISIPDMSSESFRKLLVYLYTDEIELDSVTSACDLFYGAEKYMLPQLTKVCTTYISCNLSPQTVVTIYKFAKLVGENQLMNESLQMMRLEAKTVLQDSSLNDMDAETLLEIFKMDPLNIDSELDLYAAAEKYAKVLEQADGQDEACGVDGCHVYQEEENYVEKHPEDQIEGQASGSGENKQTQTDGEDKENDGNKELIRALLQEIRFLTLTTKQLAEYKTLASLLTQTEILALFMNISSSNTHMPMPSGFSTFRDLRDRS